MPPHQPNYDESLVEACTELAQKWISLDANVSFDHGTLKKEFKILSAEQKREFISILQAEEEPLDSRKLLLMEVLYDLNREIVHGRITCL